MKLRPYQLRGAQQIREALRIYDRVLYQAPTGAGKTVLFSYIAKNAAAKRKRVYILVHRQELIKQASKKLLDNGVIHGIVWKNLPITQDIIQVCSIQTLVNRLGKLPPADILIIDEAHHATSPTYRKVIDSMPSAMILGVTATPERRDGVGLNKVFKHLILGPEIKKLMNDGYLAKYLLYIPPSDLQLNRVGIGPNGEFITEQLEEETVRAGITGDAIKEYNKVCPGVPALVYTVSVKIAYQTAQQFCDAGIPAACVEGSMPDDLRAERFNDFESGKLKALINVDLVSEGTDIPEVVALIDLQPTKSTSRQIQKWGRVFRPKQNGGMAILLDHAGNRAEHGNPCAAREWTLEGSRKRKRNTDVIITCDNCFVSLDKKYSTCPFCGHKTKDIATGGDGREEPDQVDGDLIKVTPEMMASLSKPKTKAEYIEEAKKKGRRHPELYAQIMMENQRT